MSTHRQVDVWMIRVLLIAAPGTVMISRRAAGITLSLRLSSAPGSTRGLKNHIEPLVQKRTPIFVQKLSFLPSFSYSRTLINWFRHDVSPSFVESIEANVKTHGSTTR